MKVGGTNNFPAVTGDQVLIYPIPSTWPDGTPLTSAQVAFASSPGRNPVGATYEVAFSPYPGDFTYYTSLQAKVSGYTPCGMVWGPDFSLIFSQTDSNVSVCKISGGQWYMNYRVINCPAGQTCGQTFYVPKQ